MIDWVRTVSRLSEPIPDIRPMALMLCVHKHCFLKDFEGVSLNEMVDQLKTLNGGQ
jgi:hypothetical protein